MSRSTARIAFRTVLGAALVASALLVWAHGASAAPRITRFVHAEGTIVPIPPAIPHEAGDMVDRRILPDLRWIAAHFPVYVTDGYSGPLPDGEHVGCHGCHVRHSDHYNGLAVDIVPLRWSARCDRNWRGVSRLARWAEPRRNRPRPPFRWVGYNGDPGHGCGNHLHLSWEHAAAPQFRLAEWVEVFPVHRWELRPSHGRRPSPAPAPAPAPPAPAGGQSPAGPTGGSGADSEATSPPPGSEPVGGISSAQTGGVSP